jgi:hypothetical protein
MSMCGIKNGIIGLIGGGLDPQIRNGQEITAMRCIEIVVNT